MLESTNQQQQSGHPTHRLVQSLVLLTVISALSFASGRLSMCLQAPANRVAGDAAASNIHMQGFSVASHNHSASASSTTEMQLVPPPQQLQPVNSTVDRVKLFAGVLSASANRQKRDAVRQTWGSHPRLARVVFVMAKPTSAGALDAVWQEAMEAQDIIFIGHIEEHYLNITYQSLEVFRAAHAFHGQITHVLKCDDDSYVHVDRLLDLLAGLPFNMSWAGKISQSYSPTRDPNNKWYVSKEEWPEDQTAMKWSNGPGYVLTADLVRLLATGGVAKCAPGPLFKLEDIAVGSWLTCLEKEKNLTIQLASDSRFNIFKCDEGDVLSHYMTPSQMQCIAAQGGKCC